MLVIISSKNQVKINATENVFRKYFKRDFKIETNDYQSENHQPIGKDQTIEEAIKRAKYAIKNCFKAKYGIGIEAGLIECKQAKSGYVNQQICVISDRGNYLTLGISSGFELPKSWVREMLESNLELDTIVYNNFKIKNIGEREGIIDLLSKKQINRKELTEQCVMMALIPRLNADIY